MYLQDFIQALQRFWTDHGCLLTQPYGGEVGAGTFNPQTFLRALGPKPWAVAYVEPSRRPADGRYAENPNRMQHFYQFQVLLKPSPPDIQELYLKSLESFGIDLEKHDVRFVHDDWESPTLGAWGLGWEVWLDNQEISQFTYFQQVGGIDCNPVAAELTYGIERICQYLQGVSNVYDLEWGKIRDLDGKERVVKYGEVHRQTEVEWSTFNFQQSRVDLLLKHFDECEAEARRLVEVGLVYPAYDYTCKCSHLFNLLDARGAISVTERAAYILRVRRLSSACARLYVDGPPKAEAGEGESA